MKVRAPRQDLPGLKKRCVAKLELIRFLLGQASDGQVGRELVSDGSSLACFAQDQREGTILTGKLTSFLSLHHIVNPSPSPFRLYTMSSNTQPRQQAGQLGQGRVCSKTSWAQLNQTDWLLTTPSCIITLATSKLMAHLRGIQTIERALDSQLTDSRASNTELETAKEQLANQVTELNTHLRLALKHHHPSNRTISPLKETNNDLKEKNTGILEAWGADLHKQAQDESIRVNKLTKEATDLRAKVAAIGNQELGLSLLTELVWVTA